MWRIGRKLLRTLYRDDVVVGMVDTPEIATAIVEAMNAAEAKVWRCECGISLKLGDECPVCRCYRPDPEPAAEKKP
jgi:hypothetical protein